MTAFAGKPAAADPPLDAAGVLPVSLFRPQPVRTRAATAVTPSTLVKVRMCSLSSHRVRAERGYFSVTSGALTGSWLVVRWVWGGSVVGCCVSRVTGQLDWR